MFELLQICARSTFVLDCALRFIAERCLRSKGFKSFTLYMHYVRQLNVPSAHALRVWSLVRAERARMQYLEVA